MSISKVTKTYLMVGTMLFGMFFGAGNLIFPIQLGQLAGEHYWLALAGFLATAIGLPFIGILAVGLSGTDGVKDMASRVHPLFGIIFSICLYLIIGPLFALPRTATVPFAVGIQPYIGSSSLILPLGLFSFLFFACVCYFSLNPAKAMDYIGKYLTPIFLLVLFLVILVALIHPMGGLGNAQGIYASQPFTTGFKEGYNTMDALASLAFGIVVINAIKLRGITGTKQIAKVTLKSGLVAMILMMVIYGCITFIGGTSVAQVGLLENGGLVLGAVSHHYFGTFGGLLLAAIIILACMKTSIGLVTSSSTFFHELMPQISYKKFVVAISCISYIVSNVGLTNIVKLAVPVLMVVYPVAIVLILLTLFANGFHSSSTVYFSAVILTLIISLIDGYNTLITMVPSTQNMFLDSVATFYAHVLPLYSLGLGWLVPATIGSLIGLVIYHFQSNKA
ncbi:branched-chain amino acid transport system II carrier protein [Sporolactobacillus terrae]|uniref:branched-chain amino acid transport system II carrier protein n=1 Tax=Sporolactobacillus terrae TaxID=269673 RepID=UPI00048C1AC5|nr:branched-chain amino acid transport system II carrier protein [Sporolactobacillus terrae]